MNKKLSFYLVLSFAASYLLSGCGKKHEAADEVSAPQRLEAPTSAMAPKADIAADSFNGEGAPASNEYISSSAASQPKGDSVRKFIRTANVKFKVSSVIKTTSIIEDIVSNMGGFVAHTNLTSNQDNKTLVPVSEDSSLETTYYTVTNSMMLRVPDSKLDSTLRSIAANVEHLDYRIITADDISLQLMANSMAEKRLAYSGKRIERRLDQRIDKLPQSIEGIETLEGKGEEVDSRRISTLAMMDRVKFSTIQLDIYQRQAISREMLPNDLNIAAYEPGFGSKLEKAFEYGWDIFAAFIIAIAKLWGFILFGVILAIVYRRFKPVSVKKEELRPSVAPK